MQWLLSTYTLRLNHRRKLTGHLFSGRYKALLVDGSGNGYLKTVCDYVHLNPARAGILKCDERLLAYPWSSLPWYLTAREHRPPWIRTERLLGAHGLRTDTAARRLEFEQRMEARRRAEADEDAPDLLENDWCLGSDEFRERILEQMETKLGENHSGELIRQSAEAKAETDHRGGTPASGLDPSGPGHAFERRSGENGPGQPFAERNNPARDMDRQTPELRHSQECPPAPAQLATERAKQRSGKGSNVWRQYSSLTPITHQGNFRFARRPSSIDLDRFPQSVLPFSPDEYQTSQYDQYKQYH